MTKRLLTLATLCCATLFAAPSATIDGHWTATLQSKRQTQPVELNLKAQDNQLTGDVKTVAGPKNKERTIQIENGAVTGGHFSFTTIRNTKKGVMKFVWDGTVNGDQLKGTRTREGGKHGIPFTAQRS
ncbi:MAG: hypothetical protein ACR2NN_07550 [Bryobacteraceae bacterium]